jgi:hypothetical protein
MTLLAPWADHPLPDPSAYYRGWKEPRVLTWGKIRRALSGWNGEYETSDFQILLSDTDYLLRTLDDDDDLVNDHVVVRMITDEGRRALETPRVVYRGLVRDVAPLPDLQYQLTIKDFFVELFSATTTAQQVPRRTIGLDDFPNCAQELVQPSGEGYQTSASAIVGATTMAIDSGVGIFPSGSQIEFAGHATIYAVTSSTLTDPETSIELSPPLTDAVADNEAIIVHASFRVPPAAGVRVPIAYGHITDRNVIGGDDQGDGQAPVIYVGDRELPDGHTYGEFLWTGHACFSPGGRPIEQLYFWNEAVDFLASGSATGHIRVDGVPITLGDLVTEAGSGGRICLPGYANWDDQGFMTSYRDYGGRRYTVYYLRGIWRDWALGILPAPTNMGGMPFCINAYGCETEGDGTGDLIQDAFDQYLHILQNWIPPIGDGYQSGAWLTTPMFVDDPTRPMIDEASFAAAQAQSAVYVTDGFRGDFIVGARNEAISARALIARLNVSFGCEAGFNRHTQFFVSLVNTDLETTTLQPALEWVRDIFQKTFSIESRTRELYTTLAYRYTQDYVGRAPDGWRSGALSGVTELEDPDATTRYAAKTISPDVLLYMVRGKHRESDGDEYLRGSATAEAVLALKLKRAAHVQHVATLRTGPAGFNYELGDVLTITDFEGVGPAGWVDVPCRIERIEIDPSNFTTTLEVYDLRPLLEEDA